MDPTSDSVLIGLYEADVTDLKIRSEDKTKVEYVIVNLRGEMKWITHAVDDDMLFF